MKYNTRLIYVFNNKIGEYGWKVKKFPFFSTTSAGGLTHDILEHSRNDKGTWYEEIAAFGAILAYRADSSDFLYPILHRLEDKIQALAKELANLLENVVLDRGSHFFCLPKTHKIASDFRVALLAKITATHMHLMAGISLASIEDFLMAWLSKGFIRASKVIEDCRWDGSYIWGTVKDTISGSLFGNGYYVEGQEVSVQINFDNFVVEVVPVNYKLLFNS